MTEDIKHPWESSENLVGARKLDIGDTFFVYGGDGPYVVIDLMFSGINAFHLAACKKVIFGFYSKVLPVTTEIINRHHSMKDWMSTTA